VPSPEVIEVAVNLHRYLQAISHIEKNIFSVLPMPFGQRSLANDFGLAIRENVSRDGERPQDHSRRHSDDQPALSPFIRHSTQLLVRPVVKEQGCETRDIGFHDLSDENRMCTEFEMLNDCTFKVRRYAVDDRTSV
jgi:hypothetical protein